MRANWKGNLRISEVVCPVALYAAASTSGRISFHTLNRATGNRVRRQFVDSETGDVVDAADQVKGYETGEDEHVILQPEEIAAAVPDSDKALHVEAFIPCGEVDALYFDRPYYLAPSAPGAAGSFALIRDVLAKRRAAAVAHAVLFRRLRTLLIRPHGGGMIATTLHFDYEVRPVSDAFSDIPQRKISDEMRELAEHIIRTKSGTFDPSAFDDRYESALAELVKAKLEGRKIRPRPEPQPGKVVDLLSALRESAKASGPRARKTAGKGGSRAAPSRAGKSGADKSGGTGKAAASGQAAPKRSAAAGASRKRKAG